MAVSTTPGARDVRLLRVVQLDASDAAIWGARVATRGEWAVPGGFMFMDDDPAKLAGARRQAFNSGFIGVESFGWSTLVEVALAGQTDLEQVADALAAYFMAELGAPGPAEARAAAASELDFARSLCDHPIGTLVTISRAAEDDGVVERFATITPGRVSAPARPIDLLGLMRERAG